MKHWNEDDFTQWIYGLKDDAAHLDECPECHGRSQSLMARRAQTRAAPDVSREFLAAQRRAIYTRLGQPVRNWAPLRWGASLATVAVAGVLSVALWQQQPAPAPLASAADDKLFSELVSIDQSNEPRALKPIHSLFEQ